MISTRHTLKGNISNRQKLSGKINISTIEIKPELEDITITPTKEQQTFTHENSDGYDKVTINPIPDEYIIPDGTLPITENTTYDVRRFARVTASVHPTPNLQDKNVTITDNGTQIITADSGYDGLGVVEVITEVGSGSSDVSEIKTLDELKTAMNNSLGKYLNLIVDGYPTYTNESVTLYTPYASNMYYMIRKRNDVGTSYGILWLPECSIWVRNSSTSNSVEINCKTNKKYPTDISTDEISTTTYNVVGYTSPNYTSFEECIQAIQNPSTTYTTTSSTNSWGNYRETDLDIQATNLPTVNINKTDIAKTRRISSDETIQVIS